MSEKPFRLLPEVGPDNEHFWHGGAEGELRFLRCQDCQTYVHPPAPLCPDCLSRDLAPEAVSGRARLHTYTINHQPWVPGFDPPYLVAIVDIEEQDGLRLTTNLVDCEMEDVEIGMRLKVRFEAREDGIFIPLFAPDAPSGGTDGGE
ncbi:MAG: OB-fold domain-containing protein [Myxococcota bacterium]|nr:OB-fold domain-containing protein [Myxococcota bacterium]